MLKELVQYLVGLGVDSAGVKLVDVDCETQLVVSNGRHEARRKRPRSKNKSLHSLSSLIDWAWKHGTPSGYFVLNKDRVTFFTDAEYEFDFAGMDLVVSRPFAALLELAEPKTPKQMLRLLRSALRGHLDSVSFISAIEKIDFRRAMTSSHSTKHGSESMGRSVEMQVNPACGNLDEQVSFTLPLWSNPEFIFSRSITCAVNVDHEAERISIEPVADEKQYFLDWQLLKARDAMRVLLLGRDHAVDVVDDCCATRPMRDIPVYLGDAQA